MSLDCISVTRVLWKFQAQSPLFPSRKTSFTRYPSSSLFNLLNETNSEQPQDHQTSFYLQDPKKKKALNLMLII